jgi:hypothetical protein
MQVLGMRARLREGPADAGVDAARAAALQMIARVPTWSTEGKDGAAAPSKRRGGA